MTNSPEWAKLGWWDATTAGDLVRMIDGILAVCAPDASLAAACNALRAWDREAELTSRGAPTVVGSVPTKSLISRIGAARLVGEIDFHIRSCNSVETLRRIAAFGSKSGSSVLPISSSCSSVLPSFVSSVGT